LKIRKKRLKKEKLKNLNKEKELKKKESLLPSVYISSNVSTENIIKQKM
jgi:hypothetical protein